MVQLKFFFFKPVKEISYMVLDRETQVKGRGFIDMGLERFVVAVSPLFSMVVLSLSGKLFPSLSFPVALIIAVSVLCILYVFCLRSLSAYFEKRES